MCQVPYLWLLGVDDALQPHAAARIHLNISARPPVAFATTNMPALENVAPTCVDSARLLTQLIYGAMYGSYPTTSGKRQSLLAKCLLDTNIRIRAQGMLLC
jgi:hypothetical protein